jgi:hypothetical protein
LEVLPLAEPPKSYLLFAAMAMMGGALGRQVYFGQDFRQLWPMLNVLLIGPSGIGKSTSIVLGKKLLEGLPKSAQPQFITGAATPEKLHEDLFPNPHAIIFAPELATFFNRQDYNASLIPYVTNLLDYDAVERRTKGSSLIRIEEPSVSLVGGSTVEWLQEQLPDTASAGGFLARFLIVEEKDKGQKIADPESAMTEKQRMRLETDRTQVQVEFRGCLETTWGKMKFKDYGALDAYTIWYSSHTPASGHLAPFAARAGEFIKRIAMLMAVSRCSNDITETDVEAAIGLYGYCEKKLQNVVVPKTVQGKLLARVLDAVGEQSLSDIEIRQAMRNYVTAQDADRFIQSLLQSRDLIYEDGRYKRTR